MTPCNRSRPLGSGSAGTEGFEAAEALHRQGSLPEAEALYRAVLERQASHFGCLHNLGLLYAQLGRFEDAFAHLRAALRQNSSSAEAHNNLGNVLASLRRRDEAIASYRGAIALKPDFVEAHNNLANALAFQGNTDEAVAHYARALALRPGYAAAHVNLGNVLKESGRLDEAIARYEEALGIDPGLAEAHCNIADVLQQRGMLDEAIAHGRRAIALKPGYAEAHNALGNLLRAQGRLNEAGACYEGAIAVKPNYAEAHSNLAVTLLDRAEPAAALASFERAISLAPHLAEAWLGRAEALQRLARPHAAIAACRELLARGIDAEITRFILASLGAEAAPAAAPRQFVVKAFDRYAGRYEQHMTAALKYRTPELLLARVAPLLPQRKLHILDLGCGTGLLGMQLHPLARELVGVDLSANMLRQAEERKIYQHLVCAELVEFLHTQIEGFDLVAAADVLVYIGDLSGVFRGTRQALRAGGLFGFSVEISEVRDFQLQPTRRYGHSRGYLERLSREHGFVVEALEAKVIRQELGDDVGGYIAALRRS